MEETQKSEGKLLEEKLFNKRKCGWTESSDEKIKLIMNFADEYMYFMNNSKIEREVSIFAKDVLEKNGFKNIETLEHISIGDKVYFINREKSVYAAIIGKEGLEAGLNIVGAHMDSPRLDLKPNPIYEDSGFVYLNTQYYGGIKNYQWTTIPLAIHGVIVKVNGEKTTFKLGEDENDPIFTITDLLPHLAREQLKKPLANGVEGESLDLLIGSIPYKDESVSQKVKLNILKLLNDKYGITERDFLSAEIELVPAFKARSLGFDRSMVAAYGQDDKVCCFTGLRGLVDMKETPEKTSVLILADKEEIGSMGNTGMCSQTFDNFIAELLTKSGINRPNLLNSVFCKSSMLSADVSTAYDPLYGYVSDRNNVSYAGYGISMNKYTGGRGKGGSSDAGAEFVAKIRNLFENNNVAYQIDELGKVDAGGGGTIAYILADKGVDVIDCGVGVLSMHAPYEVTSKFDIYTAYEAYKTFFEKMQ